VATAEEIQQKLRALYDEFAVMLPSKLEEINDAWRTVLQSNSTTDLNDLIFYCHKLAGAGTSFGFQDITESARAVETELKNVLNKSDDEHVIWTREIKDRLALLIAELLEHKNTQQNTSIDSLVDLSVKPQSDKLIIYIQEKNHLIADDLTTKLIACNYSVRNFSSLENLKQAMIDAPPDVVIIDSTLFNNATTHMLEDFKQQDYKFKLIHIADTGNFEERLKAVRVGADCYLTKPVDFSSIVDIMDKLSTKDSIQTSRVLIVDDSDSTSQFYSLLLKAVGIETRVVTDPFKVMDELIEFKPELILLDLHMPGCNGLELAAVIRQQGNYISTPIVFLSGETDAQKQLKTLEMGADEFLTKPVNTKHLIAVIESKLIRYRQLSAYMHNDSLTGLLNHTSILSALDTEISRSKRESTNLSYAMIDIDHFKSINDTYGHHMGDMVIKHIARFIKQRLRITDHVGRYGGEEFVAILPGVDARTTANVMQELLEDFSKIDFMHYNQKFHVTFSCGIADFEVFKTAASLVDSADKALYVAKKEGRNCIRIAS